MNDDDRLFIYNGPFYESQRSSGSNDYVALSCLGARIQHWQYIYTKWCRQQDILPQPSGRLYQTLWQIIDAGVRYYSSESWHGHAATEKLGLQWSWDQIMAGMWLQASNQCPRHCNINPTVHRLDRSSWVWNEPIEKARISDFAAIREYTDAHVVYPLSDAEIYRNLRRVWNALFDSTDVIDTFRDNLMKALETVNR